jgi:hypothetical protein
MTSKLSYISMTSSIGQKDKNEQTCLYGAEVSLQMTTSTFGHRLNKMTTFRPQIMTNFGQKLNKMIKMTSFVVFQQNKLKWRQSKLTMMSLGQKINKWRRNELTH